MDEKTNKKNDLLWNKISSEISQLVHAFEHPDDYIKIFSIIQFMDMIFSKKKTVKEQNFLIDSLEKLKNKRENFELIAHNWKNSEKPKNSLIKNYYKKKYTNF